MLRKILSILLFLFLFFLVGCEDVSRKRYNLYNDHFIHYPYMYGLTEPSIPDPTIRPPPL